MSEDAVIAKQCIAALSDIVDVLVRCERGELFTAQAIAHEIKVVFARHLVIPMVKEALSCESK